VYPSAHLAASLLLNEVYRGDRASAAAGAVVPDLIDKTLAWLLGVTPSGRHAAHSLAGAGVLTLATAWLAGPTRGASFGASYLCHLVGDLWGGRSRAVAVALQEICVLRAALEPWDYVEVRAA